MLLAAVLVLQAGAGVDQREPAQDHIGRGHRDHAARTAAIDHGVRMAEQGERTLDAHRPPIDARFQLQDISGCRRRDRQVQSVGSGRDRDRGGRGRARAQETQGKPAGGQEYPDRRELEPGL
jgi:hypothetical protein